jgi:hypothetical protein
MGTKKPDLVPMEIWRGGCETVQQMADQGWDVVSQCKVCRLEMAVRLDWIMRISGPDTSLWNRTARCRRRLCQGEARFLGRPPGCFDYRPLEAPWPASRAEPPPARAKGVA